MSKIPQKICRICEQQTAAGLVNILLQRNFQNLIPKFVACANVTFDINDELPKYFCQNCISILNISYNFKMKCEETQEKFKKLLQIDFPSALVSLKIENFELPNCDDHQQLFEYSSNVMETEIDPNKIKSESNDSESVEGETTTLDLIDENYQYIAYESKKDDDKSEKLMKKCPICFKEFKLRSSVTRHIKEKHTPGRQKCKLCDEIFSNSKSLSLHKEQKHSIAKRLIVDYSNLFVEKVTAYECFICKNGKDFRKRYKLSYHMSQVHSDKVKPSFPCEICGKLFPYAANKRRHIQVVHFDKRLFVCSSCGKRFGSFYELENHETVHSDERNFECTYCKKKFKTKDLLRQHTRIMVHETNANAEDRISCEKCNKSIFSNKLQQHIRTQCGINQYKCQMCPKTFLHKLSLNKHNLVHTGEKPYKCEICLQNFRQINHLHNHRRTHTGEKPYRCKFCEKAFSLSGNLKDHERLHTGEKPYQCNLCEEKFGHSKALKKHAATIHVGRESEALIYTLPSSSSRQY